MQFYIPQVDYIVDWHKSENTIKTIKFLMSFNIFFVKFSDLSRKYVIYCLLPFEITYNLLYSSYVN
jgi:hypothetical protein